jgi:hypothetical protein
LPIRRRKKADVTIEAPGLTLAFNFFTLWCDSPRGGFDYLLGESTGISERLLVVELRLGRRTALTLPLLPPPQKN